MLSGGEIRGTNYLTDHEDTPKVENVTGQRDYGAEYVLVPRKPTKEMLKAAWADALGEDAEGVWSSMIETYERSRGNSDTGNG